MEFHTQIQHTESLLCGLDREQLHALVTTWDCGYLDQIMRNRLIPLDAKNYPDEYTKNKDFRIT